MNISGNSMEQANLKKKQHVDNINDYWPANTLSIVFWRIDQIVKSGDLDENMIITRINDKEGKSKISWATGGGWGGQQCLWVGCWGWTTSGPTSSMFEFRLDHFWSNLDHFWSNLDHFWSNLDHFWSNLDNFWFEVGPEVVQVGPLLVQPQMVFFEKSSKIGLKTKIWKKFQQNL